MGRTGISGVADKRDRAIKREERAPSLKIIERDGYWHIHGTIRVAGKSLRVRKSTGFPAVPSTLKDANDARFEIEKDFRDEALYGIKPSVPIEVAVLGYFTKERARPLNKIDVARINKVMIHFKGRRLNTISEQEWKDYVALRMVGNQSPTRERFLNVLMAFLNDARKRGYMSELPTFERVSEVRKPKSRKRRRVLELTPSLIAMMIEEAAPHLKPQLAVMWCGGTRVASLLYGCRFCDLTLTEGAEQIVFHDTKNGEAVTSVLNSWAVKILQEYIVHRGIPLDRESPLFLTDEGEPYADNDRAYGGQTKSAFNGMKRRVVKRLRDAGRHGEADLIEQITPHWLRHYLATRMLANGADVKTIMQQGGWLRMESIDTYAHVATERQREAVNALETPDTDLTRGSDVAAE